MPATGRICPGWRCGVRCRRGCSCAERLASHTPDVTAKKRRKARVMIAMIPAERRLRAGPIEVLDRNPVPDAVDGTRERGVPAFGGVAMRLGRDVGIVADVLDGRMVE